MEKGCSDSKPKNLVQRFFAESVQQNKPNVNNSKMILKYNDLKSQPIQRIRSIQQRLNEIVESNNLSEIHQLVEFTTQVFPDIANFIVKNKQCMELHTSKEFQKLNNYPKFEKYNDSVEAICIIFSNDSLLNARSGIKFYSDCEGLNLVKHSAAGSQNKSNLQPVIFNQANIWSKYYFNCELLPLDLQERNETKANCIIYGIPSLWQFACWVCDAIPSALMVSQKQSVEEIVGIM